MRRREFVILGGAAIGWPLAAQGQQKARRIGILMGYAEGDAEAKDLLLEFTQALSEFGWIEQHNLQMDVRWAPGRTDRARKSSVTAICFAPSATPFASPCSRLLHTSEAP
jgi:hypothetical protein